MLNINAIPKPYDNIRPKGFFIDRKNQIVEKLIRQSSYKSFNKKFALKGTAIRRLPVEYNAAWEELKAIAPWVLFMGAVIINILMTIN